MQENQNYKKPLLCKMFGHKLFQRTKNYAECKRCKTPMKW